MIDYRGGQYFFDVVTPFVLEIGIVFHLMKAREFQFQEQTEFFRLEFKRLAALLKPHFKVVQPANIFGQLCRAALRASGSGFLRMG